MAEIENQRYGRNKNTLINHSYINSGEYRRKFDRISNNKKLNSLLYQLAKKMLTHRSGTKFEDMYWIDSATIKVVAEEIDQEEESKVVYSRNTKNIVKNKSELITIHSHPSSFPPSVGDLNLSCKNNYALGVVVCHNGKVFIYKSSINILCDYFDMKISEYKKLGNNDYDSQISAIEDLKINFLRKVIVKEMI